MTDKQFYILLGVAGIALWYTKSKITETASDVVTAVNPLNYNNVFSEWGNDLGTALSGDPNFSLGSKVFDFFNGENAGLE